MGFAAMESVPLVRLATNGKALLPVVISRDASEIVRRAAGQLAEYLGKISGAKFEVIEGDGTTGIAMGFPTQFPKAAIQRLNDRDDPTKREDYLIRSHAKGLYVAGASDLAVTDAVWDLLYRIGYRQFSPGPTWEVIPKERELSVALNVREHPAYYARRIWYGYGAGPWAKDAYADWCERNRAVSGIILNNGHAYEGIIKRNKAQFDQHPEYYGLVAGKRSSSKFCISNPGLRQLVIDDALAQFARDPALQSISVEPSDGGGWCECDDCKKLGSISDRAVMLANEVATAVEAKYPGRFVGMYAYNQHSPPPTIRVHPRVVISVATAFLKGGYTVDQLLAGWQKQGATIGMREYYSVTTWDRDLPGRARGANLAYLATTIPQFYEKGARFLTAESSDNWGCNGLGYYLAARMLWDVREAGRIEELKADFLDKSFGPARVPMAEFYGLIDGSNKPLLSDDLLGRMYRLLAQARQLTNDPAILARLDDLVLYTRYVELWSDYTNAPGEGKQQAFERLIRHAYRIRKTMMVHTVGLVRDLPNRDKNVVLPKEAGYTVSEEKNIWLSNEPFTRTEIDSLVKNGMATRQLLDFKPVSYSTDLVPVTPLKLPPVSTGNMGSFSRGTRVYHTWIDKAPVSLAFNVTAGYIYNNLGDAKLSLYPSMETEREAGEKASVAPDKHPHKILLKTAFTGYHRLEVQDASAGTRIEYQDDLPMTVQSSLDSPAGFTGRWSLYFYVPKGTKEVGGYSSGVGVVLNGHGQQVYAFDKKPGYFRVPVGQGEDGRLWKFEKCLGTKLLMTVPPYLARNVSELLLPSEVIEKDAAK
ncbi:DUF4838 domain-containing protein [Geomobilimonas luticola]|uniref:DUF4838 domain-containing protein n=1 Tax=Geomobilimonas luticola TaxID=1114878 RepID=A0ABS5SCK9_9BACT|nr:DUF4838 domain-containing protein [Geomobilimonas luticola]MBT0653107.1 DUF4838 domain-containing protein [Geomobilimonas luticola]